MINLTNKKIYVTITGGGISFLSGFAIGGVSSYFIGANIPYSYSEVDAIIGYTPEHYCSINVAEKLSTYSFNKCIESNSSIDESIGLGVSCSLRAENEREDRKHRVTISVRTALKTFNYSRTIEYLSLSREEEELWVTERIEYLIACAINNDIKNDEYINTIDLSEFYYIPSEKSVIFPGSFNPIHIGHQEIYLWTLERYQECYFEISGKHPDKGCLTHSEIKSRIDQIREVFPDSKILVDFCPMFYDKSIRYNNSIFIMGEDTLIRLINYDNNKSHYNYFKNNCIRFIVFGRNNEKHNDMWDELLLDYDETRYFNNITSSSSIRCKK